MTISREPLELFRRLKKQNKEKFPLSSMVCNFMGIKAMKMVKMVFDENSLFQWFLGMPFRPFSWLVCPRKYTPSNRAKHLLYFAFLSDEKAPPVHEISSFKNWRHIMWLSPCYTYTLVEIGEKLIDLPDALHLSQKLAVCSGSNERKFGIWGLW